MDEKRILIVEDEPRIALALCRALEHQHRPQGHYEVEISPVAETAMSKLQGKPYDLIVTDLRMPGMGGLALIRQVREFSPQTPALLITAFGSKEVERTTHKLGCGYLPKPFSLQRFVSEVQRLLSD